MFLKSILNICWIYIALLVLFLCLYGIYSINAFTFYIGLTLILLIGIILDKRFILSRKIIFISLLLLQLAAFMYLEIIPIILIKDIFWFSVVLNIGFVWHYLILIWLYDYAVKKENKYWCFIISRISLLTSLSIINIIISIVLMIIHNFMNYTIYDKILFKYEWMINWIVLLLVICYKITSYFIVKFNLYSLYLLGVVNNKYKLNIELLKNIGIFIIFLLLSLLLGISRLYIIWIFYGLIDIIKKILDNKKFVKKYNLNMIITLVTEFKTDIFKYNTVDIWCTLEHDIYYDYIPFLISPDWFFSYDGFEYFNIYDFMNIFVYDLNLRIKIYIKYLMYSAALQYEDNLIDENDVESWSLYISQVKLNCDIKKLPEVFEELKSQDYFKIIELDFNNELYLKIKYILGLKKGRYMFINNK